MELLALLLFIAFPTLGENLYVDPNNPEGFATISAAVKGADEGDVIFVSEGFYVEHVSIEKNISLIGEGADRVLLTYAQIGNTIDISAANDTTTVIEGLTVIAKGGWGIAIADGGSATILNCTITKCSAGAISMINSQSVIHLNRLVENTVGAISIHTDQGSMVTNNIIKDNAGGTGDTWGNTGAIYLFDVSANTLIANNLLKGNQAASAISCWGASPTIKNNVITANTGSGIFFHTAYDKWNPVNSAAPIITSNIVTDNGQYGLYDWQQNANEVVIYNDVYNNAVGDYLQTTSDLGDIDDDPEFVNPSKDDYHLQEGSPCIDAGATGAVHVDPDGSRNDMGLYGGPFAALWIGSYNGPIVTSFEVNPASVQQGGTSTGLATGTTVRE